MPAVASTKQPVCQRIVWLDYAKAIGIFFVVWGHMGSLIPVPPQIGEVIERCIYAFHMPLFFLLCGIVLAYKCSGEGKIAIGAEVKKRVHRLLLPYGFWCTVFLLIRCTYGVLHGKNALSLFLPEFYTALTGSMAPMWFLYTLFMVETAFLLIWKYVKSKHIEAPAWWGILLVTAALTIVLDGVYKQHRWADLHFLYRCPLVMLLRFFPALFFLTAGYIGAQCAFRLQTDRFGKMQRILPAILCAALFFILESGAEGKIDLMLFCFGVSPAIALPTALLGSCAVIFTAQLLPKNFSFLQKIGRESLHIMVLHFRDMKIGPSIARLWTLLVPSAIPCTGFAASVMVLLLSYACAVYLFEPLCRLAKARFDAIAR